MRGHALQPEAQKLVDYINSLGNSFEIVIAHPETHIGAIVADAVLQVGHRWITHVGPRVQRIKSKYPGAATIPGILTLLETVGAKELLNWNGTDEQSRFCQTVQFFKTEGIESVDDLRRWLASDDNRDRLITKSHRPDKAGIDKIADKTADYYRVMVGLPDAVAIDSLISAFLRDAGVRRGEYRKAREIVQLAAKMLSEIRGTSIRPIDLDQSIWKFQSELRQHQARHPASNQPMTLSQEAEKALCEHANKWGCSEIEADDKEGKMGNSKKSLTLHISKIAHQLAEDVTRHIQPHCCIFGHTKGHTCYHYKICLAAGASAIKRRREKVIAWANSMGNGQARLRVSVVGQLIQTHPVVSKLNRSTGGSWGNRNRPEWWGETCNIGDRGYDVLLEALVAAANGWLGGATAYPAYPTKPNPTGPTSSQPKE